MFVSKQLKVVGKSQPWLPNSLSLASDKSSALPSNPTDVLPLHFSPNPAPNTLAAYFTENTVG